MEISFEVGMGNAECRMEEVVMDLGTYENEGCIHGSPLTGNDTPEKRKGKVGF
jgi:hypothetical protein